MNVAGGYHERVLQLLLVNGLGVNAMYQLREIALHLAISRGKEGFWVVRILLDSGADTEAKGVFGSTALLYAARNDY